MKLACLATLILLLYSQFSLGFHTCPNVFSKNWPVIAKYATDAPVNEVSAFLMARIESELLSRYASSGYQSPEVFKKALRGAKFPELSLSLDYLLGEANTDFAIVRKERRRLDLMSSGFKNTHQTGISSGTPSRSGMEKRTIFERTLISKILGVNSPIGFKEIPPEVLPKYGLLIPAVNPPSQERKVKINSITEDGFLSNGGVFGGDIYVFDKSQVRKMVTFHFGDSLESFSHLTKKLGSLDQFRLEIWSDQIFFPWAVREFLAPFVADSLFRRNTLEGNHISMKTLKALPDFQYSSSNFLRYIELQFWGELPFSKVKAFIYTRQPPEGAFLSHLLSQGIEIIDGRDIQYH